MFRTALKTKISNHKISHDENMLSIGSCFATMIGGRLLENKFNSVTNPFGIIFNPISIFKLLNYAIERTFPMDDTYIEHDGIWYNYDLHSSLSNPDKEVLKKNIESKIEKAYEFIQNVDYLIITLGTAFVYTQNSRNKVVANCHKLPAINFTKRLLEVDEVVSSFMVFNKNLSKINKKVNIILTVSPVRHVKDTLALNMVSKSTLGLVTHKLAEKFPHVHYFPSYEIMIDDLRDYRFYKPDMIHVSEVAEQYIWEQFMDTYFPEKTKEVIEKWQKIKQALAHKPFHPNSLSHHTFLKDTLEKTKVLHEEMNLSEEINILEAKINKK